jgi:hypothetical protein
MWHIRQGYYTEEHRAIWDALQDWAYEEGGLDLWNEIEEIRLQHEYIEDPGDCE